MIKKLLIDTLSEPSVIVMTCVATVLGAILLIAMFSRLVGEMVARATGGS